MASQQADEDRCPDGIGDALNRLGEQLAQVVVQLTNTLMVAPQIFERFAGRGQQRLEQAQRAARAGPPSRGTRIRAGCGLRPTRSPRGRGHAKPPVSLPGGVADVVCPGGQREWEV
ncbi:hypothetical protein [Frankia sp. Cas4]|uniref:hypothetical protein n=1 Tax=Frankia sp. Cas4 TaxID=3073927 RepID=UPI002AD59CB1|nr:hypothetical protein [Frankia sp. Cas4]